MAVTVPDGVITWLLEPDNQPVRYRTLTRLLDEPETSGEARAARAACADYPPTRTILSQAGEYRDDDKEKAYTKYTGRYWQIIFLGQYLADGQDPRVRDLATRLIASVDWQQIPRGGQCLTANLLGALCALGYAEDPVVRAATLALARRLVRDGGIACEAMDYSLLAHCYMAGPKQLLCFAECSALRRQPSVTAAVNLIRRNLVGHQVLTYVPTHRAEWLAVLARKPAKAELGGATVKSWVREQRDVFLAEHGLGELADKPGWMRLGFPLHYNSDLLEALYSLALCGTRATAGLRRPLELLRGKLTPQGKVILEAGLNGKMRVDVETVGRPSKWLTYRAWYVLRHFGAGAA